MLRRFLSLLLWLGTGAFLVGAWRSHRDRRQILATIDAESHKLDELRDKLRDELREKVREAA